MLFNFSKNEKQDIFESIPLYARFKDGLVSYKTEIIGKIKSCIPLDSTENQISEILHSENVTEADYWEHSQYLYSELNPDIIVEYVVGFFQLEENYTYIEKFAEIFFGRFQYFLELLKPEKISSLSN